MGRRSGDAGRRSVLVPVRRRRSLRCRVRGEIPRIGIDRRWAYSFGVSSGLLAFGIAYESVVGWLILLSFYNFIPTILIYDKRFTKSKVYMKRSIFSLSL